MNKEIYLDTASTAPIRYFAKDYYIPGNPNSNHAMGLQANQALNEARKRIMDCLGVKSGRVLFCRCATEAVEWLCRRINLLHLLTYNIVCSSYEHESVKNACYDNYNIEDFDVLLDPNEDKVLYLHQYVNQLTGTVFPIESIGKRIQSTGAFFGSDFTAAIGHYFLPNYLDSFCDAVWFSGHKFSCESGIGAIWLSDRLFKYLGGDEDSRNEYGLIHGTPNVSAAVAMSYAMEVAIENVEDNMQYWDRLAEQMMDSLAYKGVDAFIYNDLNSNKTWAINAIYLPNINADALTQYLSTKSIYISPGHSACTSDDNQATRVLETFGLTKEEASQTVRISFGESTTQEDIDALVQGIVEFKNLFI